MISELSAARDVRKVLEADLRVEPEELVEGFRLPLVAEIAAAYRRQSVSAFHRWLARQQKNTTIASES
jgi:hypothetical protein